MQVAVALLSIQACCFDIKSFHHTCPVIPEHKPFLVVNFKDNFYIDYAFFFGARPASDNSNQIGNALINIWSAEIGDNGMFFKLKDNINCFYFPNSHRLFHNNSLLYAHNRNSVLDLVLFLNVPWHPEKSGTKFCNNFSFISFAWDLLQRCVALPEKKHIKYLTYVISVIKSYEIHHNRF